MVLLISYDLRGKERPSAYEAVRETIESNSIAWARPLHSQWFVETNKSARAWQSILKGVIDSNDRLFICEISRYHGWLPEEFWDWLRERGLYPSA